MMGSFKGLITQCVDVSVCESMLDLQSTEGNRWFVLSYVSLSKVLSIA